MTVLINKLKHKSKTYYSDIDSTPNI